MLIISALALIERMNLWWNNIQYIVDKASYIDVIARLRPPVHTCIS